MRESGGACLSRPLTACARACCVLCAVYSLLVSLMTSYDFSQTAHRHNLTCCSHTHNPGKKSGRLCPAVGGSAYHTKLVPSTKQNRNLLLCIVKCSTAIMISVTHAAAEATETYYWTRRRGLSGRSFHCCTHLPSVMVLTRNENIGRRFLPVSPRRTILGCALSIFSPSSARASSLS